MPWGGMPWRGSELRRRGLEGSAAVAVAAASGLSSPNGGDQRGGSAHLPSRFPQPVPARGPLTS